MGVQEREEPTSEMNTKRDNSRGALKLGKKSVRLLSAVVVLVLILAVALILFGHLAPAEGPHIAP